jgi:hypothetical protein
MEDRRYKVLVEFTVTPHSDDYLQSPQAIEEEFESWLEGLRAVVHHVTVQAEAPEQKEAQS